MQEEIVHRERALGQIRRPPSRMDKPLGYARKAGSVTAAVCKASLRAVAFPFRTFARAAVSVPLAGYGLHWLIAPQRDRNIDSQIPDILYRPVSKYLNESKDSNAAWLAASRQLRSFYKGDYGWYRDHLKAIISSVGESADKSIKELGITDEMLDRSDKLRSHLDSLFVADASRTDEVFARVLKMHAKELLKEEEDLQMLDVILWLQYRDEFEEEEE